MEGQERIHLAVVEDITLLRQGICHILTSFDDYQVDIEADNGKVALEKLRAFDGRIDICLLDINMPEMDGHTTIALLKKEFPQVKVLILSMYDDDHNVIRMLRNGANGYLLKSAGTDEIKLALKNVYEKGFYHSDLVKNHLHQSFHQKDENPAVLSDKDVQFLSYCCSELTYKEIASKMKLSPRTVEGYRDQLCARLDIKSRTGLVMFALKVGVVPFTDPV